MAQVLSGCRLLCPCSRSGPHYGPHCPNYFATKLIFTHLPGPPAALPAFRTSDGHIRCYSLTSSTTGTYDGFGGGTNEPLAPGVYCFVDLDSNLPAGVTGPGCQEPSFMSVTNAAAFSPQGLCTGDEAIERKTPEPSASLPVAKNGQAIDIAGAVCQVSSSGLMVVRLEDVAQRRRDI